MSLSPAGDLGIRTVRVRTNGRWTTPQDVLAGLRIRWQRGEFLAGSGHWSPIVVPLRAPTAAELGTDYAAAGAWVGEWRSRTERFALEWTTVGGRRFGVNDVPRRLRLETPEQVWSLLGVTRQVERHAELVAGTLDVLPCLTDWLDRNPMKVLEHEAIWQKLIGVVGWFGEVARPGTHLRQIDVAGVDTKFVESHRGLLAELLDVCLPEGRIAAEHQRHDFVRRYRLASKPTYLRLRRLDQSGLYPQLPGAQELSLRSDELIALPVPCRTVFVVENEISYLAFPVVPDAVAVFGGGYAVSVLTAIGWLGERDVVYWGDIDTHGLVMLDRFRAAFPQVRSILMDRSTFLDHEDHWGREPTQTNTRLAHLTAEESRLYEDLLEATFGPALRLEQERIRFPALQAALTG